MRTKLLLIPLVPAIAIGVGLVARELADDAGAVTAPTIAPVSVVNEAPPPPAPPPCGPNCGTDA